MKKTDEHLALLMERYPVLAPLKGDIYTAYTMLRDCYEAGGKLLLAGNGGRRGAYCGRADERLQAAEKA